MFKWFSNKSINARIKLCTKEVLWDLEQSDPIRCAEILTMLTLLRWDLIREGGSFSLPLDSPSFIPRETLIAKYEGLEHARNMSSTQGDLIVKQLTASDLPSGTSLKGHLLKSRRALEVLMITIGIGINSSIKEDVRSVWNLLHKSAISIDEALTRLREFEDMSNALSPWSATTTFSTLDFEFLKQESTYSPSIY